MKVSEQDGNMLYDIQAVCAQGYTVEAYVVDTYGNSYGQLELDQQNPSRLSLSRQARFKAASAWVKRDGSYSMNDLREGAYSVCLLLLHDGQMEDYFMGDLVQKKKSSTREGMIVIVNP